MPTKQDNLDTLDKEFNEKFGDVIMTEIKGKVWRFRESNLNIWIKEFIRLREKRLTSEIIDDYKKGLRCLNCGSKKKGKLTDYCLSCLENG